MAARLFNFSSIYLYVIWSIIWNQYIFDIYPTDEVIKRACAKPIGDWLYYLLYVSALLVFACYKYKPKLLSCFVAGCALMIYTGFYYYRRDYMVYSIASVLFYLLFWVGYVFRVFVYLGYLIYGVFFI